MQAECTFNIDFTDSDSSVYAELMTSEGESYRLDSEHTQPCFWMSGGSIRVMQKRFPKADKEILSQDLPYINGVQVNFTLSKDESEAMSFDEHIMSFFQI